MTNFLAGSPAKWNAALLKQTPFITIDMKPLRKNDMVKYWYEELTGNFLGFVFGTWATGLLSHFFETRSVKNLWGLAAKKTVIAKETFTNLEWIISILIGFVVFVLYTKVVQKYLEKVILKYKRPFFRWVIQSQYGVKINALLSPLLQKSSVFTANLHHDIKQKLLRHTNRP